MKRTIKLAIAAPLLAWLVYNHPAVALVAFFIPIFVVLFIRGVGLMSIWIDHVANGRWDRI